MTLIEVLNDYMERNTLTEKKIQRVGMLQYWLRDYTVATMSRERINEFFFTTLPSSTIPPHKDRKVIHKNYNGAESKTYALATCRKYYFDFKVGLEDWALRYKFKLGDRFEKQKPPAAWKEREQRCLPEQQKVLIDACDGMYKAPFYWKMFINLSINLATRVSELLQLKVKNIHLVKGGHWIFIDKTTNKTKIERSIPLSDASAELIQELLTLGKHSPEERLFKMLPEKEFSAGFRKIVVRANTLSQGLYPKNNFVAGDLRHEALIRYVEAGLDLLTIMLISGHSDIEVLKGYVKKYRPNNFSAQLNLIQQKEIEKPKKPAPKKPRSKKIS